MPESALTPMPPNVSFERAATVPSSGVFAVQVAKALGAEVTGVCRTSRVEMVRALESGSIEPLIDRTYPLAETPVAMRYLETGEAKGKIVITI